MLIITPHKRDLPYWEKPSTLVINDNRVSRIAGDSNRDLLERLSRPAQNYYDSLEVPSKYPSALSNPLVITDTNLIQQVIRKYLRGTLTEVANLLTREVGWNGYNAPKPEYIAIVHAARWLITFFQEVAYSKWVEPNVTSGPEGEVVFEWWYNRKKLTIYVGKQNIDYIQVWGTEVDAEITDGEIESIDDCRPLWMWLTDVENNARRSSN